MELLLPDEITEVRETYPTDLVIISIPKIGKTTITSQFTIERNAILFNLQKGGTDYVKGRFIDIYKDAVTPMEKACDTYVSYRNLLLENKGKYDFLIVDNLSELDEMSELMGTKYFMSLPQGKSWNRDPKTGKPYNYGDPNWKMVTEMGEGYGYRYTRKWFLDQIDAFRSISPYRIYIAHVKDKLIQNSVDEMVNGTEISLTGKLKRIFAADVSTMSKMIADGEKRYLSFEVDNDNTIAGSRVPTLEGQILISEKTKDGIVTYWDKIYGNLGKIKKQ